jgi:hypothetical protein
MLFKETFFDCFGSFILKEQDLKEQDLKEQDLKEPAT